MLALGRARRITRLKFRWALFLNKLSGAASPARKPITTAEFRPFAPKECGRHRNFFQQLEFLQIWEPLQTGAIRQPARHAVSHVVQRAAIFETLRLGARRAKGASSEVTLSDLQIVIIHPSLRARLSFLQSLTHGVSSLLVFFCSS
jgi:hypothetical protein